MKYYDPLNETIDVKLIEDEEKREQANTIGYFAMFEYQNGFTKTLYWSKEKMQAHAKKYSQAYRRDLSKASNYSFWSKDFDGMGFKTMLRQLISKWGIMSVDFQTALINDMAVIRDNEQPEYVDNVESEELIEAEITTLNEPKQEEHQTDDPFDNL